MASLDCLGKTLIDRRKAMGFSQAQMARKMATTQSAVARLEGKLLRGKSLCLKSLEDYAQALGGTMQYDFYPRHQPIKNMAEIIRQVDYTMSVEGLPLTKREQHNLERVGRGEISFDELLAQYIQEARELGQKYAL